MATGDLKNNLRKLQTALKQVKYSEEFDVDGLAKGIPQPYLRILHYVLVDFSIALVKHFSKSGFEFYGKNDWRFIEIVYKLCREEFSYKPLLTKEKFFTPGFAERKLIMACDIIKLCQDKDSTLRPKNKTKVDKQKEQKEAKIPCPTAENVGEEARIENTEARVIAETDVITEDNSNNASSVARVKLLHHSQASASQPHFPTSTEFPPPQPTADLMVTPLKEPFQLIPLSGERGVRTMLLDESVTDIPPVAIHPEPLLEVTFQDETIHEQNYPPSHSIPVDDDDMQNNQDHVPLIPQVFVQNEHQQSKGKNTEENPSQHEMEKTIQNLLKQNQEMLARIFLLESRVSILEDERNAKLEMEKENKFKESNTEDTSPKTVKCTEVEMDAVYTKDDEREQETKTRPQKIYTPDKYKCGDSAAGNVDEEDSTIAPSISITTHVHKRVLVENGSAISPLSSPAVSTRFSDPVMKAKLQNLEQKFKETKEMLSKSSRNQVLMLTQIENIPPAES